MGSFFALHYQFNLFFRFPLLRAPSPPVSEKRETLVRLSSSIGNQRGVRGNAKVGIHIYGKVFALFKAKGGGVELMDAGGCVPVSVMI